MRSFSSIILVVLLGAACADLTSEPVAPEAEGLVLGLDVAPRTIVPGDTAHVVVRLKNTNPHEVTLHFASGCQILWYVEDAAGRIVEPRGGERVCTGALTSLRIGAGQTETRGFAWTGQHVRHDPATGRPIHGPLDAGAYRAYATLADAELNGRRLALRTASVPLTLR